MRAGLAQESTADQGVAGPADRQLGPRVVVSEPTVVGYDDGPILYGRSEAAQAQGAQP